MNNTGKNLFERALQSTLQFGTRRSPNAIVIQNAVIIKRNFAGKDIPCKDSKGKTFIKKGRRFTLVLTEDLFNALVQEKGNCSHSIWAFDKENPDLKVYTIEVNVRMESSNPPMCKLFTKRNKTTDVNILDSTNIGILDEIYDIDIERIDLVLNPYDPDHTGNFTLWLRDLKLSQNEIEDSDDYWSNLNAEEDALPFTPTDPNLDVDFEQN